LDDTEARIVVPVVWIVPVAIGGTAVPVVVDPGATTQHTGSCPKLSLISIFQCAIYDLVDLMPFTLAKV